jgi:hypothetical protein
LLTAGQPVPQTSRTADNHIHATNEKLALKLKMNLICYISHFSKTELSAGSAQNQ